MRFAIDLLHARFVLHAAVQEGGVMRIVKNISIFRTNVAYLSVFFGVMFVFYYIKFVQNRMTSRFDRYADYSGNDLADGYAHEYGHDNFYQSTDEPILPSRNPAGRLAYFESRPESWVPLQLPEKIRNVSQTDPELIRHIQETFILPPSDKMMKLDRPGIMDYSQFGQSVILNDFFGKDNGFYIDCGAGDGEKWSKTLMLEKYGKWNGILIEESPPNFRSMLKKRRHAHKINTCLSPKTTPTLRNITIEDPNGHAWFSADDNSTTGTKIEIQCLPFYSILAALDFPHVDLVTMEVGKPQTKVIRTIPLSEIDVDVFVLTIPPKETHVSDWFKKTENMFKKYGYVKLKTVLDAELIMTKLRRGRRSVPRKSK